VSPHIAFLFSQVLTIPPSWTNNREYYASFELLRRGHKITWVTRIPSKQVSPKEKIIVLNLGRGKSKVGFSILSFFHLYRFLLKSKVDIVWICGYYSRSILNLLLLMCILKFLRKKIIYDPIDPIIIYKIASSELKEDTLKERMLRFLMRRIYQFADLVLAVTEEMKEILVRRGVDGKKIHAVYCGTDKTRFNLSVDGSSIRKEFGLESKFVIGWIGSMSPFKGVSEIVIPLIKRLKLSVPEAFFLIGGRGPLQEEFVKLKKDDLEAPFIYLGTIPYDLTPLYTNAFDLYIIPLNTQFEFTRSVLPAKLFDALATGTPTLVTLTPATQRLSRTFQSMTLVEDNPEAFEKAIVKIKKDYEKIKLLAIQDAKKMDAYTAQNSGDRVSDLIERLLSI